MAKNNTSKKIEKHGRKGLPFKRLKSSDAVGVYWEITCRNCTNKTQVRAVKNLPDDLIDKKFRQQGWEGVGRIQSPGVYGNISAYYLCPDCQDSKDATEKEVEIVDKSITVYMSGGKVSGKPLHSQKLVFAIHPDDLKKLGLGSHKNQNISVRPIFKDDGIELRFKSGRVSPSPQSIEYNLGTHKKSEFLKFQMTVGKAGKMPGYLTAIDFPFSQLPISFSRTIGNASIASAHSLKTISEMAKAKSKFSKSATPSAPKVEESGKPESEQAESAAPDTRALTNDQELILEIYSLTGKLMAACKRFSEINQSTMQVEVETAPERDESSGEMEVREYSTITTNKDSAL